MGVVSENKITLGVLSAIQTHRSPTQRTIATELGIALGLANSYLRRCVTKGYIKVSQAPANRYVYYLTPKGFAEKSRLTAEFLRQSFSLFRQARSQYRTLFAQCRERGWTTIGLVGVGDLCEIAILCAHESGATVAGVVEFGGELSELLGVPVKSSVAEMGSLDALLLTEVDDAQTVYERTIREFPAERVLVPELLEVSPMIVEKFGP